MDRQKVLPSRAPATVPVPTPAADLAQAAA